MTNPSLTQCLHRFCYKCISDLIHSKSGHYCRCPLCDEKVTKRSLRPQSELWLFIKSIKRCIDLFQSDNQLTSLMASDEELVFDSWTQISGTSKECFRDITNNTNSEVIAEDKSCNDLVQDMQEVTVSEDNTGIEIESNGMSSLPTTDIVFVSFVNFLDNFIE